jgi:hypothetical protein
MKIELRETITAVEELLAGLQALDGTEIDENARGRSAREQRTGLSVQLQWLAHTADSVRVTVTGFHLSLRDRERGRDGAAGNQAQELQAPRISILDPFRHQPGE